MITGYADTVVNISGSSVAVENTSLEVGKMYLLFIAGRNINTNGGMHNTSFSNQTGYTLMSQGAGQDYMGYTNGYFAYYYYLVKATSTTIKFTATLGPNFSGNQLYAGILELKLQ